MSKRIMKQFHETSGFGFSEFLLSWWVSPHAHETILQIFTDGFMKFPSERQTKFNQTQGCSSSTARWHTEGTFTDI